MNIIKNNEYNSSTTVKEIKRLRSDKNKTTRIIPYM